MAYRKSGANTVNRNRDGTFGRGNPGKPKGARHKATLAAQKLLDGEAEALTRKAVELALEGDVTALRLCLERIAPSRKDRPVFFDVPEIRSIRDSLDALSATIKAVSTGELTPEEGLNVAKLMEAQRRLVETDLLEQRLADLEAALSRK